MGYARDILEYIEKLEQENYKLRKLLRHFMEDEVIQRELDKS
jgi:hypothetical protein